MYNRTNTGVHFDGKGGNIYLRLRGRSNTIYATQVGCSIFHPGKFEQAITRQHVLLRQESLIDTVTIILCLHVLITCFMLFYFITLIGGDSCRDYM